MKLNRNFLMKKMALSVFVMKSLKYLPLGGFEHPLKTCDKLLNVFFNQIQLKYTSRQYSVEKNTDIFETARMQKYLNYLANENTHDSFKLDEEVVKLLKEKMYIEKEIKALENMSSEGDKEMEKLIEAEKKKYSESIEEITQNLYYSLLTTDDENDNRNVELQLEQGIGGEESKLFAQELLQMYTNYAEFKNWEHFREGSSIYISGEFVFGYLKHEAGVHRVQRVPETEKTGRTHTSTCSVVVLPQPKPQEIQISDKDLIIEKKRSSGPGGQNVNKRETCVKIKHIPTGITVESQTERCQHSNLRHAIDKLRGIIFNMEQEKISKERRLLKKEQAGLNDYSDKIRTYHYTSNRITDHRVNYTTYNLKGFLEGNKELDLLILKVREYTKKKELISHIENILNSEEYKKFEKHQTG